MAKNPVLKKSLVKQILEGVSKEVFKKHFDLITKLVENSHGVYALYDGSELYYVGKSTDLKKRVKQHMKDKHFASWSHFSIYLVRDMSHIHDIETLLIRIANPKGNQITPRGKAGNTLKKTLVEMVKEKQKKELNSLFKQTGNGRKAKGTDNVSTSTLVGLVRRDTRLFKSYKGKEYTAVLKPSGVIILKGKKYSTPTAAALAVVDRRAVNGWNFWYLQNENRDWVRLSELRLQAH